MSKSKKKSETPIEEVVGLTLYTDGGWRQVGGWGVHGYSYNVSEVVEKANKNINAPSDAGYLDKDVINTSREINPVKVTGYIDGWGSIAGESTNNVAELKAGLEGFKLIDRLDAKKASIISDSKYFLDGLSQWCPNWVNNNWKRRDGTDVPNRELWESLIEISAKVKEKGCSVRMMWVKGHSDNLGNDMADKNATRGVILAKKGLDLQNTELSPVAKYWDKDINYNRLIAHPNWYFSVGPDIDNLSKDGRHIYYCGQHDGANEMLGKRVSTHAFSVLFLKEPEPVLETIRDYQNEIQSTGYCDLVVGYLTNILTSSTYAELAEYGSTYVTKDNNHDDLYSITDKQLTWQARPPKLAQRAITSLNFAEHMLEEFLAGTSEDYITTDVTSYFYDTEETKKGPVTKLKNSIVTSAKSLDVVGRYKISDEVKEAPVTLTFGLDLPPRIGLSAIAVRDPKITLLTYRESELGFRYCVVIEVGEDVGIFNSIHSNLKVVPES